MVADYHRQALRRLSQERVIQMRDLAHVYKALVEARERLENAKSDAEFLTAQAHFEQIEAEWYEVGEALGLA